MQVLILGGGLGLLSSIEYLNEVEHIIKIVDTQAKDYKLNEISVLKEAYFDYFNHITYPKPLDDNRLSHGYLVQPFKPPRKICIIKQLVF